MIGQLRKTRYINAAILLVSIQPGVVRSRLTILRNYGDSTYRYFYPCLLFATVTIESSLLLLQIEITGNFSLRNFEHCKWKEFPMKRCILTERTGTDFSAVKHQSHQPSSSFSVHQKQEMNSSDIFRHLCCKALVDR